MLLVNSQQLFPGHPAPYRRLMLSLSLLPELSLSLSLSLSLALSYPCSISHLGSAAWYSSTTLFLMVAPMLYIMDTSEPIDPKAAAAGACAAKQRHKFLLCPCKYLFAALIQSPPLFSPYLCVPRSLTRALSPSPWPL